ncbi:hypothetical protein HYX07_03740 [Candidatus Woesearchaeota archaeon]|nr:hypothetical protein [Candidatus Woesearchaeota archaeon]
MDLIARLESFPSNKGILFRAIDAFSEPSNIQGFFKEYVIHMARRRIKLAAQNPSFLYLLSENPAEAAIRNVVYALVMYDEKICNRWLKALPEISPFYKEFYQPPSRKLRKHMYKP